MTFGKSIIAIIIGGLLTVAIVGAGIYLWVDINQALNAKHNAERELPEVERQMEELNRANPVANSPQPIAVIESKPCKASKAMLDAERKADEREARTNAIIDHGTEQMIELLKANGGDPSELERDLAKSKNRPARIWNNCGPDGKELK